MTAYFTYGSSSLQVSFCDPAIAIRENTYLESILIIIRRLQIRRRREWSIRIRCWLGIWLDLGCHFDAIDVVKAVSHRGDRIFGMTRKDPMERQGGEVMSEASIG